MRSLLPTFIISTLFRTGIISTSSITARRLSHLLPHPSLEYPICRTNLIYGTVPFKQDFRTIMTDYSKGNRKGEGIGCSAQSTVPCGEGGVLGKNEELKEALEEVGNTKETEGANKEIKEESQEPKEEKKEEQLPQLSPAEFRVYNKMAEGMEYYHNHFRQTWTLLLSACENNKRPANLSLKQFISTGLQFCSQLTIHHSIEEQHIFPILATKMPEFKAGRNAAELLRQHKEIHKGMDRLGEYLEKCRSGEVELELKVLKAKLETWGEVLWTHLDQEVKTLGAENMRKYWTLEEMRKMPM